MACPGRSTSGDRRNAGVELEVVRERGLLSFQSDRGFAGCSEPLLRRLCQSQHWRQPEMLENLDAEHQWAVTAMLNWDKTLVPDEVVDNVVRRHQAERATPDLDDRDLEELVRDTMLAGDQDDALRELTRRRTTVTASSLRPSVYTMYKNVVAVLPADEWAKCDKLRKQKEKRMNAERKRAEKAYERSYAKLTGTIDERMRGLLPVTPVIRVWTDAKNGRWRLSFNNDVVHVGRSISWTLIGQTAAATEVVRQCWMWRERHDGIATPADLDKRITEVLPAD